MAYKLDVLKRAENDLDKVLEYKSQIYPGTADRFLDEIDACLDRIKDNPFIYQEYSHDRRYSRAVVEDYLIFFKVNGNDVKVYRVLNGKINIEEYL